jgi:menaquinone-9 beta-reductase
MEETFDAVVVGAGTAGSSAAYHLASAGLRVALVERGALAAAGARWVNGVTPEMFDRARIQRPMPPELRGRGFPFGIRDRSGLHCVTVPESPVWGVDMRLLVARLHRFAESAGVTIFEHLRPTAFIFDGERPVVLRGVRSPQGRPATPVNLRARLFVDAAGMSGILRTMVPAMERLSRRIPRTDMCSAGQEVRQLASRRGAREFLDRYGAASGEAIAFTGVEGGFSTLAVQVHLDAGEVDILTGVIADGQHGSGRDLLAEFVQRERWVGARKFGGNGVIPLRRPHDRLAVAGLALCGNSACQVFPAHGSGIGTGLVAGRILAESVAKQEDPGSMAALRQYEVNYQRELGRIAAAYDVFRRFSQRLSTDDVAGLLAAGLISPTLSAAGLAQTLPRLTLNDLKQMARAAARAPRLALRLLPSVLRMHSAYLLYGAYPRLEKAMPLWVWLTRLLFDERHGVSTEAKADEGKVDELRLAA